MRAIERAIGVSRNTLSRWLKKRGRAEPVVVGWSLPKTATFSNLMRRGHFSGGVRRPFLTHFNVPICPDMGASQCSGLSP
jgi:hypothetical protein